MSDRCVGMVGASGLFHPCSSSLGISYWCQEDCEGAVLASGSLADACPRCSYIYMRQNRPQFPGTQIATAKKQIKKLRRTKKLGDRADLYETFDKVKELFGRRCLKCGVSGFDAHITCDHILPKSKGGTDDISNLQPLCYHCNTRKTDREEDYRPVGWWPV